jgi:hypothetical protein
MEQSQMSKMSRLFKEWINHDELLKTFSNLYSEKTKDSHKAKQRFPNFKNFMEIKASPNFILWKL